MTAATLQRGIAAVVIVYWYYMYFIVCLQISYTVRYFLKSYELEIRVFKYNAEIVKIFEDRLHAEGYSIKKRLPIGEPIYSYAVYAEGNNPKDFVSTYMNILDEAIKL